MQIYSLFLNVSDKCQSVSRLLQATLYERLIYITYTLYFQSLIFSHNFCSLLVARISTQRLIKFHRSSNTMYKELTAFDKANLGFALLLGAQMYQPSYNYAGFNTTLSFSPVFPLPFLEDIVFCVRP